MKIKISVLAALDRFIFGAFGVSQLAPEQVRPDPSATRLVSLRYGEHKIFPESQLGLKFVDVASDSRCPIDVNCPWAGEIEVVLNIWHLGTYMSEVRLTLSAGVGSAVVVAGGYEIHLIGVRPSARSDPPIEMEEYGILLQITAP